MEHSKRFPYLVLAGAAAAVLFIATGTSLVALAPLLFVLACPLMMMVVMMRHMGGGHGGGEDHTGHGCEHDPTRSTVVPRSPGNRTP